MSRARLATVWLAGCSGCHMSLLDLDEALFALADAVDLVYSPLADVKEFPEDVDVVLVEGAVANADNLELLHEVRRRSRTLIAFGDCATHGNVTALRNELGDPGALVAEAYREAAGRLLGQYPGVALPGRRAADGASRRRRCRSRRCRCAFPALPVGFSAPPVGFPAPPTPTSYRRCCRACSRSTRS